MDYFSMEVQKYWAPTSTMSRDKFRMKLEECANSGLFLWSEKFDGNFTRGVITKNRTALQTRGISKVTNTYSELQDKVFFWDSVVNAFQDGDTVILAELYLPGGVDKQVGAIARCLVDKARARQKDQKLEWRIFDILVLDGNDMINSPIEERIKYIPEVVRRINNPLVKGVEYHEMTPNFFDEIGKIFERGGEGAVIYKKGIAYTPGKRSSAWTTIKVKQEIANDIDALIIGIEKPTRSYTGKEISSWQYWQNIRTGEKLYGDYYGDFHLGHTVEPITKNFYYNYPGAVNVGVYNSKGEIYSLCSVAGLTDEFKTELRDNFEKWYLCPITIGGMALSDSNGLSIRHPHIKTIRSPEDIDPRDCTLEKIISQ